MCVYNICFIPLDDTTRVILENGPNGDYINASYINLEIPNTNIIHSYIATQGELRCFVRFNLIYLFIGT